MVYMNDYLYRVGIVISVFQVFTVVVVTCVLLLLVIQVSKYPLLNSLLVIRKYILSLPRELPLSPVLTMGAMETVNQHHPYIINVTVTSSPVRPQPALLLDHLKHAGARGVQVHGVILAQH